MIIGSCQVDLMIYEASNLKQKRQVIKSLIERLRSRFNISVAEVADNDIWQRSTLGFCCVSNSSRHAQSVIGNVMLFIENDNRVEVINSMTEIL